MTNLNTVQDIAKRLGVSDDVIYYHLKKGNLDMTSDDTIQDFIKKYLDGTFKAGRPLKFKKGLIKNKGEGETMKTYQAITNNYMYEARQQAIKEICEELNLEMFKPDYHGKKGDAGTVIIYTKDSGSGINQICHFESTDINGLIDWNFLNRGAIDLRGLDFKSKIKRYMLSRISEEVYKLYNITK